jgi:predicted neutral ceramidase superfamily lipid hydrolase
MEQSFLESYLSDQLFSLLAIWVGVTILTITIIGILLFGDSFKMNKKNRIYKKLIPLLLLIFTLSCKTYKKVENLKKSGHENEKVYLLDKHVSFVSSILYILRNVKGFFQKP